MKILQWRGIGLFAREALQLGPAGLHCGLDVHRRLIPLCPLPAISAGYLHRQALVALDEARLHSSWLANRFDIDEPFKDFLPDDLQLQFGQPDPDAAMDTEA
jgi:hypothetical protein